MSATFIADVDGTSPNTQTTTTATFTPGAGETGFMFLGYQNTAAQLSLASVKNQAGTAIPFVECAGNVWNLGAAVGFGQRFAYLQGYPTGTTSVVVTWSAGPTGGSGAGIRVRRFTGLASAVDVTGTADIVAASTAANSLATANVTPTKVAAAGGGIACAVVGSYSNFESPTVGTTPAFTNWSAVFNAGTGTQGGIEHLRITTNTALKGTFAAITSGNEYNIQMMIVPELSPGVIQEKAADDGGGAGQKTITTPAFTLQNASIGSTMEAWVTCSANGTPPTSVIDNAGQNYVFKGTAYDVSSGNQALHLYVFQNNQSPTKLTATATYGTNQTGLGIWLKEIGGVAQSSYDNSDLRITIFPGTGANLVAGNAISPVASTNIFCSCLSMEILNGNGSGLAAGTGYTLGTSGWTFGGGSPLAKSESKFLATAASTASTMTDATNGGSSEYAIGIAMYDQVSTAAGAVLAGAATDAITAAADLTTLHRLAGAGTDASTAAGALSTAIKLVGAAANAVVAAGQLTTGGSMTAAGSNTVSAAGALTTAIKMGAAASDAIVAAAQLINFASVTLTAPLYTGIGGIFDPNVTWPFSTPVVGSVISYDPTILTVLADGSTIWTTNSGTAEIQYNDGTNVNEVDLFVTPLMVGNANDVTSAIGALVGASAQLAGAGLTSITAQGTLRSAALLAGAAVTLASAAGSLTTGIKLSAAASTLTSAIGDLITAIRLAAAASDSSTALGSLAGTAAPLSGAAADSITASAALVTQIKLSAAAANVVTAAGALTSGILFAAQAQDFILAAGALNAQVAFAGAASDTTSAAGLLGSLQTLLAAANDVTTAAGSLMTQISMASAAATAIVAAGNLSSAIQMLAAAQTQVSAEAALGVLALTAYPNRIIRTGYMSLGLGAIAGALPYAEFFATVGDSVLYGINWDGWLANYWYRGAIVPPATSVRPRAPNGFSFKTVNGGQSGDQEPRWPKIVGATVVDGSILWTCEATDVDSLSATVQGAEWKAPQGVTIDGQQIAGQTVIAMIDTSGATVGVDYLIAVPTRMSDGEVKTGRIVIKVR